MSNKQNDILMEDLEIGLDEVPEKILDDESDYEDEEDIMEDSTDLEDKLERLINLRK
jgi:hypothetical protein